MVCRILLFVWPLDPDYMSSRPGSKFLWSVRPSTDAGVRSPHAGRNYIHTLSLTVFRSRVAARTSRAQSRDSGDDPKSAKLRGVQSRGMCNPEMARYYWTRLRRTSALPQLHRCSYPSRRPACQRYLMTSCFQWNIALFIPCS